jgi:hypothetical protein
VRVEPVQLVRCTAANSLAENRFIGVENGELFQEFFRFPQSVSRFEDGVAANGTSYSSDELNDRLVGQPDGIFDDAASENFGRNPLLLGEPAIEPINQDIGINESGHARRDPLFSILDHVAALWRATVDACAGVLSLDRTNGAVILDLEALLACLEE